MKPLVSLVLAFGLLFAGCSRPGSVVEKGAREQVMHLGNKDEPSDLDPHTNTASSTNLLLSSLFEGLVRLAGDGETILPGVAEQWEISPDGLVYTFHLRADARWSNGDALTAKDFHDSFLRLLNPKLGCELAAYAFPIIGARDFIEGRLTDPTLIGLRAPDARTFIMTLRHPAPYWLSLMAQGPFYPLHRRSVEAAGGWNQRGGGWTRGEKLVSNGAFKLVEWRPNAVVRVVRNDRYWDAAHVRLREVRFYPTDDEASEERTFRAGQLHATYRLPQTKLPAYEHAPERHISPQLRTDFITFNVKVAPFTDARVRRALSLAIDRERLVRATLGKLGTPARTLIRPGTGGYTSPDVTGLDVVEAKRLLAAAGFPGGVGLPKIELTLNGNAGRTLLIGEAIQQMWAEALGVRVELRPLEFKVYLTVNQSKAYQVMTEGWGYAVADPRDLLQLTTTGDPNNTSGWSNAAFDAAFAAADQAAVRTERARAFATMEALIAQEVPCTPLFYTNQGYLIHPTLRGWRDNALHIIDWRELWLEPTK